MAGVVLAKELSRDPSFTIELIENQSQLGGLMRSVQVNGATYDIGAFNFDENHQMFKTFPFLWPHFIRVPIRAACIRLPGSLDGYPATFKGYSSDFGLFALCHCFWDLLLAKAKYRKRENLSDWLKYYLGESFVEQSGLRNYIERFYRLRCDEVDIEFASQRLLSIQRQCGFRNFGSTIPRRLLQTINSLFFSRSPYTQLIRPHVGFSWVYGRIANALQEAGVSLILGKEMERIVRHSSKFQIILTDCTRSYDRIISTLPVPIVSQLTRIGDNSKCDYMSLVSLFFRFTGDIMGTWNYLYNFTQHSQWKRVTLYSRLYGMHNGEHYLSVEGTSRGDPQGLVAWHRSDFEKHISTLGILRGQLQYEGGTVSAHAYPVYRRGNSQNVRAAKAALRQWGIEYVGRQGSFDYLTSAQVARNAASLGHDLRDKAE